MTVRQLFWWILSCLLVDGVPAAIKPAPIGYSITPIDLSEVNLEEGFWSERMKTHANVTIPHVLQALGVNYADPQPGRSALALVRTLEGVSHSLRREENLELREMMERMCSNIGKSIREGNEWFGAVPEAPAFLYLATGKKNDWLKEALKEYRKRDEEYFGTDGSYLKEPESHAYYGMAIVSLYQATGEEYFKNLAQKFMDIRGMPATGQRTWPKFAAQHKPVQEMNEPGGHAGSFGWFASALVDVAALTGESKYGEAAQRIWKNMVNTRICITGGTGSVSRWEGFGEPFAIGRGGYNETCAASGQVFYNYRLGMLTKDAQYFDVMEAVLYNGFLSGVSLSGNKFFYTNVLESAGHAARREDRRVPCCHGSVARTIPQVPSYFYGYDKNDIYVTLYASSSTNIPLSAGKVGITQRTKYPFDGKIKLTITPKKTEQTFNLRLRIPTWTGKKFIPSELYFFLSPTKEQWQLRLNGKPVKAKMEKGFAILGRNWNSGDEVELYLPMPVRFSECIEKVKAYRERVAVTCGPLVFCAEGVDNNGPVRLVFLPAIPKPEQVNVSTIPNGTLKGMTMIRFPGMRKTDSEPSPSSIKLVPYFSWENRGAKSMSVWFSRGENKDTEPLKFHPSINFQAVPRSKRGPQTEVIFENHSENPVKLYWIGYKGERQAYGTIKPKEKRTQVTYANNTWVVTDNKDKPIGYFLAGHQISRALIPDARKN